MAARGTARSQFRRGPAGPDECALNERERGHSARPLRNHLLGGERRPWRLSLLARRQPRCWSHGRGARHRGAAGRCAPRADARLALARRRRWAAAARITPLSITVRAAARLPLSYRCTWRRPAAPAPPFYRLPPPLIPPTSASPLPACLAVSPCTTPLARIPRPLHPQEQPHSHPNAASLCPTWQACCLALLVEEGTRVSAASVAVRHSAAGLSWAGAGQVQARAGSRLWCTYVSAACGAVWCTYGPTRER